MKLQFTKPPEMNPENYEEIYEMYEHHHNPEFQDLGIRTFHRKYKPNVTWGEGVSDQVAEHVNEGNALAIVMNHQYFHDQFHLATYLESEEALRPLVGNIFIWAKTSLFTKPLVGRAITELGAMPVFRSKDYKKIFGEDQDKIDEYRKLTNEGLIRSTINRINNGENWTGYAEGTRNTEDFRTVQEIKKGVGIIATEVNPERNLGILVVGNAYETYGNSEKRRPTKAHSHMGQLIEGPFDSVEGVQNVVRVALQEAVDVAFEQRDAA